MASHNIQFNGVCDIRYMGDGEWEMHRMEHNLNSEYVIESEDTEEIFKEIQERLKTAKIIFSYDDMITVLFAGNITINSWFDSYNGDGDSETIVEFDWFHYRKWTASEAEAYYESLEDEGTQC